MSHDDLIRRRRALVETLRFELIGRALIVAIREETQQLREKTVRGAMRGAAVLFLRLRPELDAMAENLPDPTDTDACRAIALEAEHLADTYYERERVQ